jgi:hypothetical protein
MNAKVVLNELNIIVVVVYSRVFHKKHYSVVQYIAVFVTLLAGLVPMFNATGRT